MALTTSSLSRREAARVERAAETIRTVMEGSELPRQYPEVRATKPRTGPAHSFPASAGQNLDGGVESRHAICAGN